MSSQATRRARAERLEAQREAMKLRRSDLDMVWDGLRVGLNGTGLKGSVRKHFVCAC